MESYINPQAGELIRSSNESYTCNGDCAVIEFTEPLEDNEALYNQRPSFNRGSVNADKRMSVRGSTSRGSFGDHLTDDQNTHDEFMNLIKNEFPNLGK